MLNCVFGDFKVIKILAHRGIDLVALHMLPQFIQKPPISLLKLEQLLLAQVSLLHLELLIS